MTLSPLGSEPDYASPLSWVYAQGGRAGQCRRGLAYPVHDGTSLLLSCGYKCSLFPTPPLPCLYFPGNMAPSNPRAFCSGTALSKSIILILPPHQCRDLELVFSAVAGPLATPMEAGPQALTLCPQGCLMSLNEVHGRGWQP